MGNRPDGTVSWVNKPNDRKLEDDYLKQIMIALGSADKSTKQLFEKTVINKETELFISADESYIQINEKFDLAWRKIGIAIDRLSFSIEDRI